MSVKQESEAKPPEAPPPPGTKPEDAGEALELVLNHAGSMGRYQRWLFLAMLPFGFSMAFIYFVSMFVVVTPESHWCHVPELEHLDWQLRRQLSIPGAITAGDDWTLWDRCSTYDTNWTVVLENSEPPHPDTPTTATCPHGWLFEFKDVPYETVVSERGWVCEHDGYVPLVQWTFFAGAFAGGLLFGWLADHFGRVPALVAANLVGFVGGVACIFTSGTWDFALCRFIAGMAYDNCFMLFYILVLEYVGAKHRTLVANLSIMLYFGGGCVVLPWLALWVANWRTLMILTSAPMLFALFAPFLFPESVRWLSSRGKHVRAVKMLRRIERVNGNPIPIQAMDDFIALSSQKNDDGESLKDVLVSHSSLRLLFVLLVTLYACCSIVFDGLIRLSGSLGMDMFVAFTLSSATEFPSLLLVIVLLDRLGRRAMAVGTMTTIGGFALIAAFVNRGIGRVALAVSARFFANMAFNTTIQWVAELLPSGARAAGSSLIHVTAFLLTSASPYVVYLEHVWSGLPFVIIAAVAFLAAVVSAFLPETMGQVIPHNCVDAEHLIYQHSLLGKLMRSPNKAKEDENKTSEVEDR